jgi:hypothetical protein
MRQSTLPEVGFLADFGFYPFLCESVVVFDRGSDERLLHQLQQCRPPAGGVSCLAVGVGGIQPYRAHFPPKRGEIPHLRKKA